MLVRLRYFEHHLGPTPTGPGHQMGLLLQSLCASADPCWWKKNAVYTLVGIKGSPGVLFVDGYVEV